MAQTDFSTLTTSQKKLWSSKVWRAGRNSSFWFKKGMMGKDLSDATKPVHYVTELTKDERGDRCVMPLVLDLQGDGVVGDRTLEGSEENLVNDDVEISTDQLRNAVKSKGRMSEQKTVIRFRAQARDKLGYWLTSSLEQLGFLTVTGQSYSTKLNGAARNPNSQWPDLAFASDVTAPSTNRVRYASTATSTATLTTAMTMAWDEVVDICAMAKRKLIKPIRVDGEEFYCLVMSPEQLRDLKKDDDYKNAVARAGKRGNQNPLFTGAAVVLDGVCIYESNRVITNYGLTSGTDMWGSGSNVEGAIALLLGAQALGFARIGEATWEESDNTDYKNKQGIAYGRMIGFLKPVFQSVEDGNTDEDFGVIALYTAAAA